MSVPTRLRAAALLAGTALVAGGAVATAAPAPKAFDYTKVAGLSKATAKVEKTEACWNWTGATRTGYGLFSIKTDGGWKNIQAHRAAYELANGPIGEGLYIDHICHNKACVKPAHLREVTQKQNMEHQLGAQSNNVTSGIRGVSWLKKNNRWRVEVTSNGTRYYGGLFKDLAQAEAKAVAMRNELFTHNNVDRAA